MEVLDMKALGKTLAFLLVLALVGAGSATAAKMITGKEIADRTVKGVDIAKHTLKANNLTDGAKAELKGATGPAGPQGAAGPAGPTGADGKDGGPNRYAEVSSTGILQEDVKNIDQTQVDHPVTAADGVYCFTFPEGDRPTSGAATGISSDTLVTLQIQAGGGLPFDCPPAANVMVRTYDVGLGFYQDNAFRLILSSN